LSDGVYRKRAEAFGEREAASAKRSNALSTARLVVAGAFVVVLSVGLGKEMGGPAVWGSVLALLAIVFVAMAVFHERVVARQAWEKTLREVNEGAEARRTHDWAKAPLPAFDSDSSLAKDLRLFGRASLIQLLGTVSTPFGKERLASWLLHPAQPGDISRRQAAVRALAPLVDFRQELEAKGRLATVGEDAARRFASWAAVPGWLSSRRGLVLAIRLLTLLSVAVAVAWAFGLVPAQAFVVVGVVNKLMTSRFGKRLPDDLTVLTTRSRGLEGLAATLQRLSGLTADTPLLREKRDALAASGVTAYAEMRRLARIQEMADARASMLHWPLQLLTLWDFHVVLRLEAWQARVGKLVPGWLDALAEIEALSALATLHHDHPDWTFPEVSADAIVEGRGLGHPLLPDASRVTNDVSVGPPGTFLLLTGSNMSGKSTLLRALGANVVLAGAGAPVCASSLRLPALVLATSIQIEDSLEDGVSYFLSELKRLKEVVDAAEACQREGRHVTLYLLDEILRGTNSNDRQTAVRQVLKHLVEVGAIGVVSTHDLALVDMPELKSAQRAFHFRETIEGVAGGTRMTFDYRLRAGVATTTNALRLLELVGLGKVNG